MATLADYLMNFVPWAQSSGENNPKKPEDYPYGKPRFPNVDPRAYFDRQTAERYAQEPAIDRFSEVAPYSLLGLSAARAAKAASAVGDNSGAQHVYEALLGRQRTSPHMPAEPGSGWWTLGPVSIPKPTNVLPWAGAGGVGYGIWKAMGGPEAWDETKRAWNENQNENAGWEAQRMAEIDDRYDAARRGIIPRSAQSMLFGRDLTNEERLAIERARLPGGVGKTSY